MASAGEREIIQAALTLLHIKEAHQKQLIEVEEMNSLLTPEEREAMDEVASALIELSQLENEITEYFTTEEDVENEDELELVEARQTRLKEHKQTRGDTSKSQKRKIVKYKKKKIEDDDSEETLTFMVQWNRIKPGKPPVNIVHPDALGNCSEPIRKQLMESDVLKSQCRLMLKKVPMEMMMSQVMAESERPRSGGLDVSVYGPDGEVHNMMFKMWNTDTPVLTGPEWNTFVTRYDLKFHCDFLTIWMFRNQMTHQICFAIHTTRFAIDKKLSARIVKAAGF